MRLTENHAACVAMARIARNPAMGLDYSAILGQIFRLFEQHNGTSITASSARLLLQAAAMLIALNADPEVAFRFWQALWTSVSERVVAAANQGSSEAVAEGLAEWTVLIRHFRQPVFLVPVVLELVGEGGVVAALMASGANEQVLRACQQLFEAVVQNVAAEEVLLAVVTLCWRCYTSVKPNECCLNVLRCTLEVAAGGNRPLVEQAFVVILPALFECEEGGCF
jgi:hypothetical protein